MPAGSLSTLTDALVAVHGQSDQHRLLRRRPSATRSTGSRASRWTMPAQAYAEAYRRLRAVERELDEVVRSARERARETDLLRHGLAEIEAVDPQPGEDVHLAAEEQRLGFRRHPADGGGAGARGAVLRRRCRRRAGRDGGGAAVPGGRA